MPWQIKTKIIQQQADEEAQTPDGQDILVGASQDKTLITEEGFNNWKKGPRRSLSHFRILTPDGFGILVGQNEDQLFLCK
jgi:hypothetical protein